MANETEVDNVRSIVVTTAIVAGVVVLAHVVLGVNYWLGTNANRLDDWNLAWQPIVGVALSTTAIVSFGGFYIASRRARVAIGSAFILTFLAMLPFALTIPAIAPNAETDFAKSLVDQLGATVATVVAFYFGTEAVVTGIKLWTISQNPEAAAEIKSGDRDLGTHAVTPGTTTSTTP